MYVMRGVLALLILLLALGRIRRQKQEEEAETEPELSVEDLLVSTQLEEAREEEIAETMEEINLLKDSEIKRQIEKFINDKPEAAAALLRNWLNNEEW
jgi:flagellar M-ring protein FliF